ncbi:MAG: TonB-dependent receptor [Gemmatimonadetes bacterium]|nr:MAG: TonB-dependent receptor [Gemmatimonadota bacterium]
MRWIVSVGRAGFAAAAVSMFAIPAAFAQGVTTGAIAGIVSDSMGGGPLEGARVVAVHGPSGTTYAAVTRVDGRFTIPGMRVGGPYKVSASRVGYRQEVQNGVTVSLGVTSDLQFRLPQATVQLEAVTVETSAAGSIFSSQRTGAATTVSTDQLAHLPTISRRVEDLLRLTPQYSPMSFGFSFAGQDNRLNNTTIDGSYFNNSFGLAGQPGDRTGVTPISLDALEQVQVNIAPFDVRQGNFVGAGVNMVTKSGTNTFAGSAFYNTRSNSFVGKSAGPNTFNPGTFQYHDVGIALGGPILKNKLFFFASYEDDAQTAPGTTFLANTGGQPNIGSVTRVLASDLDALSTYVRTKFGYETGPYQGYDFKTPSTRFLSRLDYNLNDHNKLSVRYNLLNSETPVLLSNSSSLGLGNRRSSNLSLNFANSNYAILENIRSIVGEWNSSFGKSSNNLIVGYNTSDESRKNVDGPWFPLVEILQGGSNYTTFGFEPFTPDNKLFYHSYQLQDNFTVYLPKHSVTLGVSVEKYHSTKGVRVDVPKFTNTAYDNAVADTMTFRDASGAPIHYNSGALPGTNLLFSPRLGFNFDPGGRHTTQIRGGIGIFTGRPAYVWISNQVGNTGVLTGFIQADTTFAYPFNPNPNAYKPATVTGAPATSFQLALTDPNFKFPQLWRGNLAIDQQLPWGLTGTAEYLYSKDVNGIAYINANLPAPQTSFAGPDGRPRWTSNRIYGNVSDATVLTNQGIGHSSNIAASVERSFRGGLFAKLGYSYGTSKNTVDAGSIASGSWTGNAIAVDPNNPIIANSQFAPGHRFFGAVSYTRDFVGVGPTSISLYFDDRSAGNGSYVFSGDMNGDGAANQDLIYIPRNQGEMNFVSNRVIVNPDTVTYTPAQQAAAWDAFINQDPYLSKHRGEYAQRNGVILPMVFRADLSISQDVSRRLAGNANSLQIRFDILNFTNLLKSDWGVSQGFVTSRPLSFVGVDASGAPTYRLANVGLNLISSSFQKNVSTFDVWRMQLGVRYLFNW